eukprot:gene1529-1785_t
MNVSFGSVVILDSQLRISSVSESVYDIFPNRQQNLVGVYFPDLILNEYHSTLVDHLNSQLEASTTTNNKTSLSIVARVSGPADSTKSIPVEIKTSTFFTNANNNTTNTNTNESRLFIFVAIRDVSRIIEIDDNLKKITAIDTSSANMDAGVEGANRPDSQAKIDLLSHISHELRTPISSIVASVQLFRATDLTNLQREYLSLIDSSASSLLELIGNVLDFGKIGAGKLILHNVDFNLCTLIEDVCAMVSPQALRKGIQVGSYVFTHCPLSIYGDPVRLRQILLNLLSNGVKYTEEGEVLVNVEPTCIKDTSITLRFEIKDTGIGIDEASMSKLFYKFSQVHNGAHPQEVGGHGLGLAICRDLVDMMGGQISCTRLPEGGCSFFFTITFETPQRTLPCPVPNFDGLRVMVIDKNEKVRSTICKYLKEWNCRTVECSDLTKATKEIKTRFSSEECVDVVVVDVDNTTLKIFLKLKKTVEMEFFGKIGVIVMSKDRSMVHGIGLVNTAKLTKPIRQSHLVACLLASMPEHPVTSPIPRRNNNKSHIPPLNLLQQKRTLLNSSTSSSSPQSSSSYINTSSDPFEFEYEDATAPQQLHQQHWGSASPLAFSLPFAQSALSPSIGTLRAIPPNYQSFKRVTRRHSIDIVTLNDHSSSSPSCPSTNSSGGGSGLEESSNSLRKSGGAAGPCRKQRKVPILIVDDNIINLKINGRLVENAGYSIKTVDSGYKALEEIREIESERTLTSLTAGMLLHTPIIALTAHQETDQDAVQKCFKYGMDDFISKPFNPTKLVNILKKWEDFTAHELEKLNQRIHKIYLSPRELGQDQSLESSSFIFKMLKVGGQSPRQTITKTYSTIL